MSFLVLECYGHHPLSTLFWEWHCIPWKKKITAKQAIKGKIMYVEANLYCSCGYYLPVLERGNSKSAQLCSQHWCFLNQLSQSHSVNMPLFFPSYQFQEDLLNLRESPASKLWPSVFSDEYVRWVDFHLQYMRYVVILNTRKACKSGDSPEVMSDLQAIPVFS